MHRMSERRRRLGEGLLLAAVLGLALLLALGSGLNRLLRVETVAPVHCVDAEALREAERDFSLNWIERDVIHRHMFPLTPVPPACRESALVCLADKLCAVYETFARRQPYPNLQRMTALLAQPQEIH